jgi:hypothetical protein
MKVPSEEGKPVLAYMSWVSCTGTSKWYEVLYYLDGSWHSYSESGGIQRGEQIINWEYCDKLL